MINECAGRNLIGTRALVKQQGLVGKLDALDIAQLIDAFIDKGYDADVPAAIRHRHCRHHC
jgi:hypothetical protein